MRGIINKIIITIITICLTLLTMSYYAYATSWVSMESKDIVDKAEIIVLGHYKADSNRAREGMWVPFDFVVDKYYRGEGGKVIQASIEQFDIENTLNYQTIGGKYLLFLEKDPEGSKLMVPVGGPNGMVRMKNGIIEGNGLYDTQYIKNFLKQQKAIEPSVTSKGKVIILLLIILVIISLAYFITRKIKLRT